MQKASEKLTIDDTIMFESESLSMEMSVEGKIRQSTVSILSNASLVIY